MDKGIRAESDGQRAQQESEMPSAQMSSKRSGELSDADIAKLREYIRNCPECLETLHAELRLRRLIRRCCCSEEAPQRLTERLSLQVRQAAQQVEYREFRSQTTITHSAEGNVTSRVIVQRSERSIMRYSGPLDGQ